MKKEFVVAAAAAMVMSGLLVGCASSKTNSANADPVKMWQENRIFADVIAEKNAAGTPIRIEDVQYKSAVGIPAVAAAIETLAQFPIESYHKVVTEVDKLYAFSNGRRLFYMEYNAKKSIAEEKDVAKKKEMQKTLKEWQEKLTPAEEQARTDYLNMIKQVEQSAVLENTIKPLLKKLAVEGGKLGAEILLLKDHPQFKTLVGFKAASESINLTKDSKNIMAIVNDTTEGAKLWEQLLEDDKRFREYAE